MARPEGGCIKKDLTERWQEVAETLQRNRILAEETACTSGGVYLTFACMPGESYCGSLSLCLREVF